MLGTTCEAYHNIIADTHIIIFGPGKPHGGHPFFNFLFSSFVRSLFFLSLHLFCFFTFDFRLRRSCDVRLGSGELFLWSSVIDRVQYFSSLVSAAARRNDVKTGLLVAI